MQAALPITRAVIDIGTNSLKCLIATLKDGVSCVLQESNAVTRLGGELAVSGSIGETAMRRNLEALKKISNTFEQYGVQQILCVGAETLRRAKDADVFIARVAEELNWKLLTLSADEEARLSFQASAALAPQDILTLVIDSGGGSTEFTLGQSGQIQSKHSLPLGAVTLTQKYIHSNPASSKDISTLQQYIREQLIVNFPQAQQPYTIACGGGVTALAAVSLALEPYAAEKVQGSYLPAEEVDRQIALYSDLGIDKRKQIRGLPAERADIILAGALILQGIMRQFKLEGVVVSTYGIRHALLSNESYWQDASQILHCTRLEKQLV